MERKQTCNDFFADDNFILWRLTGDGKLAAYWAEYLSEHPETNDTFEEAVRAFSKIRIDGVEQLTEADIRRLQQRIQASVAVRNHRQPVRRYLRFAAAACVALAAGLSTWMLLSRPEVPDVQTVDRIVGENLEAQDIFLITGATTTSFSKDVRVQIDSSGAATVRETGGGEPTQVATEKSVMNKMVVPCGKRSQLELSDGTRVWINSGSTLEFPAMFTDRERSVNLAGEIYVEVMPDARPFVIHTLGMQIRVYGTKFNVTAYEDADIRSVVLVEGQVGVKTGEEETLLRPNEMLVCEGDRLRMETVDVTGYTSWKDGYLVLKQTPIASVLKQMERYYNLSFDIQNDLDLRSISCTGKLYLSDNLDSVMNAISLLSSTRYEREGGKISIVINPEK
jgi:ferric-dicitrate binding protein FerR (iron transport regulator)